MTAGTGNPYTDLAVGVLLYLLMAALWVYSEGER